MQTMANKSSNASSEEPFPSAILKNPQELVLGLTTSVVPEHHKQAKAGEERCFWQFVLQAIAPERIDHSLA